MRVTEEKDLSMSNVAITPQLAEKLNDLARTLQFQIGQRLSDDPTTFEEYIKTLGILHMTFNRKAVRVPRMLAFLHSCEADVREPIDALRLQEECMRVLRVLAWLKDDDHLLSGLAPQGMSREQMVEYVSAFEHVGAHAVAGIFSQPIQTFE